jgi:archaellum component FlaF (FlaF/FlaG flagellin family)
MKFAIIDSDGQIEETRHDTLEKAVEAATSDVSDNPDTEVEVVQIIKVVSSTLKVDVTDPD